jgi:hypothetical protein
MIIILLEIGYMRRASLSDWVIAGIGGGKEEILLWVH